MSHRPAWRLLLDPPADGHWNMAVDEALLDSHAGDHVERPVTLRLYAWQPATLSLGRSQACAGAYSDDFLRREGIDLVRRPTGGLAVLHEHERTYAVCGPLRREPFARGVLDTYRRLAEALQAALRGLGVPARAEARSERVRPRSGSSSCFELSSAYEVGVAGRKLIGSAQLRRRSAFLQHGSILLRSDPERLAAALGRVERGGRFTDLATLMERKLDPEELDQALIRAFENCFGARLERGRLNNWELERATRLYTWKYCSLAWTREGRIGPREKRWGPDLS